MAAKLSFNSPEAARAAAARALRPDGGNRRAVKALVAETESVMTDVNLAAAHRLLASVRDELAAEEAERLDSHR